MKEEYKAKKLTELRNLAWFTIDIPPVIKLDKAEAFLSQTIDELGKLPKKKEELSNEEIQLLSRHEREEYGEEVIGWNACIAEAERMRDNKLSEKR